MDKQAPKTKTGEKREVNSMEKELRTCPRCGKTYTDYPAISRKDNKTEICPECGQLEALEAYQKNQEVRIPIKTLNRDRVEVETGYRPFTTFFEDFSIADRFGLDAIQDTYNRAFKEWKSDYKYLTELVLILNWKIWEHYQSNDTLATLYNELWEKADSWARDNLQGEELSYFYKTTD